MATAELKQLHFRGAPPLMSVMQELRKPLPKRGSYRLDVGGKQAVLSVRPMASAPEKFSVLRLRVSQSTPPGTYLSRFVLEKSEVPVVVDVEPCQQLRFVPASLSLTAAPGGTVESELTVINMGNAAFNLGIEYTFCVFDTSGIDNAFFAALTDQDMSGQQRLERFLDELAISHGGLVRLTIKHGGIVIAPGEPKKIQVALRCSRRLRPGHTYCGSWSLLNFKYSVELQVIQPKSHRGGKK